MSDKIKDGGPAFPRNGHPDKNDFPMDGMSLRDYFAAKASEADIAQQLMLHSEFDGCEREPIITRQEARYYHADAMLKAREK